MRAAILVLSGLLSLGTACAAGPRLSRATTVKSGAIQLVAGSNLSLVGAGEIDFPAGSLDGGLRVGVLDRLELGAALRGAYTPAISVWGAALDAKIQLYRSDSFALALDPGVGWDLVLTAGESARFYTATLPVLAGLELGADHQLIFSPAFLLQWVQSAGAATVVQPFTGASLGVALAIDQSFTLLPSAGMYYSWVGNETSGTTVVQLSVGAFFDPGL